MAATGIDDPFNRARSNSPTALSALRGAARVDGRHRLTDAIANHLALLHLDLTDPELGAHAAKQNRLLRRAITQLLNEAISDGEISPTDAAELADTVYTVYNGALVTWAIDGTGSLTRWLSSGSTASSPTTNRRDVRCPRRRPVASIGAGQLPRVAVRSKINSKSLRHVAP